MRLPLLQTKLYIPPLRHSWVARPAITAKLSAGGGQPVTLVAAPAGFGKTTLVSEWVVQTNQTVAWLSLDEDDNDPVRFLTYLIAALQTQQSELGSSALELVDTPQAALPKAILTLLLNDLGTLTTPLVLVLDDYHVITTPAIHEALALFVERLPSSCRLLITSRMDPPLPLARWRVRNLLSEVRVDDLRFRPAEVSTFLNDVMGLTLTSEEITTLETRTEGWIAGLQLAALSLQGRDDIAGFVRAFSGSHRHVLSYLVEEVLNRCATELLDFLLQTSILDRLSAPLCDAVMRRSDSQQLLEKTEEANLFLIPLDDTRQWYRYHHLFADVLRQRLQQHLSAESVADLHHRASIWYAQAELIDEAIHHALTAQAFDHAATLVEQVALSMILHGEFARLRVWLAAIPAAEVKTRPLLILYHIWVLYISGQSNQAAAGLEAVEAMLAADESKRTAEVQGLIAITQTRLLREAGDLAGAIAISKQALANLPEQATLLRARITLNLALAHYLQGELGLASQLLGESVTTGHMARLIGPLPTIYLKAQILRVQGHLQQALRLCQEGLELVARHKWQDFPATGFLYLTMGDLLRECNDLDSAAQYLERGIRLGQAGGHHHILIIGHVWRAWLRQTEGNVAGSQEDIRIAIQLLQQHAVSRFWPLPSAACTQARLWIAQGNLAEASRWAESKGLHHPPTPLPYLDETAYITVARLRIAEGRLAVAESLLLDLHQAAASDGRNGSLIEILILQSVTYAAQKQHEKAMLVLAQALGLGEEGYIRLFVDEGEVMRSLLVVFRGWMSGQPTNGQEKSLSLYVDKLLDSFAHKLPVEHAALVTEQSNAENPKSLPASASPDGLSTPTLVETLSEREREVLQLVADGLSNTEIAARLIVTVGTVKTHINHIFGKLNVQSRTQAVVRGRGLGLLRN
ncbi:MAG: LuxR C-terminal-related transcriptional regulator [Caldilineaceae bacterium]